MPDRGLCEGLEAERIETGLLCLRQRVSIVELQHEA